MTKKPQITRDDIKAKLADIQVEATTTVDDAKSKVIAVAAVVGAVLLVGVFILGRRGARKNSTIIELRRS